MRNSIREDNTSATRALPIVYSGPKSPKQLGVDLTTFLCPERRWSRAEVLARSLPVPKTAGVYAWFFSEIPPGVPVGSCITCNSHKLLYLGISPSADPVNGKPPSRQNLRQRVRYHMCGNAEGSTLRLTLGCLLSESLGIRLQRVGSGKR